MNDKNQISMIRIVIVTVIIAIFIMGCNNSTEPQKPEERWRKVSSFGDIQMTGIYLNSEKTQLSVTTTEEFGLIQQGDVKPTTVNVLECSINGSYLEYIPYFCDEYYFYCDRNGQTMYVGDNTSGKLVGTIPITSLVDSLYLPAKYSRSDNMFTSNHIETNNNDLYMISIRQTDVSSGSTNDDKLYFGSLELSNKSLTFSVSQEINSYSDLATHVVFVRSNYYYGGYFWQYRDDCFHPTLTVVNENSFDVQYLTVYPIIRYAFDHTGYTIGVFDGPVKKSYDGGFTWEDWAMLNAAWNFVEIHDKNVAFFSHNLGSIDLETCEIENYDRGELDGHPIIGMAEFDNKVFAATLSGLFYCDIEDFFVLKSEKTRTKTNNSDLEITIH